jgi:hypothetical protein
MGQEMASAFEMDDFIVDREGIHDPILRQLKRLSQITEEVWGPQSK